MSQFFSAFVFMIFALFLFSGFVFGTEQVIINSSEITGSKLDSKCIRGSDERMLVIVPSDMGCKLHYIKAGTVNVIASSVRSEAHCEKIRGEVSQKLRTAGFTCQ